LERRAVSVRKDFETLWTLKGSDRGGGRNSTKEQTANARGFCQKRERDTSILGRLTFRLTL